MKKCSLLILVLSLFSHCTKQKVDPNELRLQEQWVQMEKEATDLDKKIKDSDSDPVNKSRLLEDRELLRSRMERLKGRVKVPAGGASGEH